MAHLHDIGYKFLFSHADLGRELLETFAPPGIAELLNYATLRPESGHFITPAMKQREDDVVWCGLLSCKGNAFTFICYSSKPGSTQPSTHRRWPLCLPQPKTE